MVKYYSGKWFVVGCWLEIAPPLRLLAVLLLLSIIGPIIADEPPATTGALPAIFADDFATDTRADYQIEGDVHWRSGHLTIPAGSSVRRALEGVQWLEVRPTIELPELREGQSCEFHLRLAFAEASEYVISWSATNTKGETQFALAIYEGKPLSLTQRLGSILGQQDKNSDTSQMTLVRKWAQSANINGEWVIISRFGLIEIQPPSEQSVESPLKSAEKYLAYRNEQQLSPYANVTSLDISTKQGADLTLRRLESFTFPRSRQPSLSEQIRFLGKLGTVVAARGQLTSGKFSEAAKSMEQVCEEIARLEGRDSPTYAIALGSLGLAYSRMGDQKLAISRLSTAREIGLHVLGPNHPLYANIIEQLAAPYQESGEFTEAETLYLDARDIRRRVLSVDDPMHLVSLNNLGSIYEYRGDYVKAERMYLDALELWKNAPDSQLSHKPILLNNVASLYINMGEFDKAESYFNEARDIHARLRGRQDDDYADIVGSLAGLYIVRHKYQEAKPLAKEARQIYHDTVGPNHSRYAVSLINLAVINTELGEHDEARKLLSELREIQTKTLPEFHLEHAAGLNAVAALHMSIGEWDEAERQLLAAGNILNNLATHHPRHTTIWSNLADVYLITNQDAKAEDMLGKVFEAQLEASEQTIPALSEAQAMIWLQKNQPRYDELLTIRGEQAKSSAAEMYEYVWKTKGMGTRLRPAQYLSPDATPEAHETLAELRAVRRLLAQLVSATPALGHKEEFEQTLRRAAENKEVLEKQLAELNAGSKRAFQVRDAQVKELLSHLPGDVAAIDFVQFDAMQRASKQIEIQREGRTESRTISGLQFEPHYAAFVLQGEPQGDHEQITWVSLGPCRPINDAIAAWRQQLTSESDNGSNDARHQLRQLVWEKLEPYLKDYHTVILLPDADLTAVPWAALPGREPDSFLIEDYSLSTAIYGQQLLGLLIDPPVQGDRSLLVGGIDYDLRTLEIPERQDLATTDLATTELAITRGSPIAVGVNTHWDVLEGARRESESIQGILQQLQQASGEPYFLSGQEATEQKVADLLEQAQYVHLATHGFFAEPGTKSLQAIDPRGELLFSGTTMVSRRESLLGGRNPLLLSGIVLAGANLGPTTDEHGMPTGLDGILTAEEVVNLDLHNTKLVTLSACDTGIGDVAAGEGVFGLQRAFHQAGARTVIASLWKVDDDATRALMIEFYKNLWVKKLPTLEALRQAQLRMLVDYDPAVRQLRGAGSAAFVDRESLRLARDRTQQHEPLSPFFWAGFTLSGDWR